MGILDRFKKKPSENLEGFPSHEHDHSSVQEADPYKWEVSHRRTLLIFRFSFFFNVVCLFTIASLAEGIISLIEEFEPRIALVSTFEKDDKLYRVDTISEDVNGFDVLMESKAKRYVRLMLEVDRVTQTERFQEAFRMTALSYYKKFKKERLDSGEIEDMLDDGLTRSIQVESVDSIENNSGVHKFAVDFIQIDQYGIKKPVRKKARAYLTMTTRPHEVREIDKYQNPLGITVLDMVLKEKENS